MKKNKSSGWGDRRKNGFTLVELLVVIAIVNILSTVTLVVLNGARDKAAEARVKSQLKSMSSEALLYSGTNTAPIIDFSASPADIVGDANGNLFTNTTAGSGSLHSVLTKLPSNSSVYYGSDGQSPSEGGKWFITAATPKGVVSVDYTGKVNSWKGNPPKSEDEFLTLCPKANTTYICQLPALTENNTECNDGLDNDTDGKIDIADEYCHQSFWLELPYDPLYGSESLVIRECSDNRDNDTDGKIDIADEYCHRNNDLNDLYYPDHGSENVEPK